jgi:hypothetical protein
MQALFLLLVDHVSKLKKKVEILYFVVWPSLNFTLKVFLQKISVRGNPKYVFKKQPDHDSPQY